jgi:transposase
LDCQRPHRHEERDEWPGVAGAGGPGRDPFAGDVFVFRGRAGSLIKALWHDGIGLSLYAKRLDRGRFIWPATVDGVVALSAAQMSYLLEAIDWRNPQHTWRPQSAG